MKLRKSLVKSSAALITAAFLALRTLLTFSSSTTAGTNLVRGTVFRSQWGYCSPQSRKLTPKTEPVKAHGIRKKPCARSYCWKTWANTDTGTLRRSCARKRKSGIKTTSSLIWPRNRWNSSKKITIAIRSRSSLRLLKKSDLNKKGADECRLVYFVYFVGIRLFKWLSINKCMLLR